MPTGFQRNGDVGVDVPCLPISFVFPCFGHLLVSHKALGMSEGHICTPSRGKAMLTRAPAEPLEEKKGKIQKRKGVIDLAREGYIYYRSSPA